MPEPAAYPGSPSLSAEAREKVLQTFRHTLEMARSGRNEDALLGCDFILKMDARFTPARRLLASLRGIASGTVVDLAEFDAFDFGPAPARPAPAPIPTPASTPAASPVPRAAAPATPAAGYAVPTAPGAAPDSFASSLDGIGFDDLGANPFAAAPATAPAPPAAPFFTPPLDPGFGAAEPAPSFAASDAFSSAPSFGTPGPDPFASAPPPDAGYPPPADPFAPAAGVAPFPPAAPPAGAGPAVDQRIVQFLKQGDDSAARGHLQEAIDLWSRVFLIDLSNEEASRRIDAARDKQSEAARQLDVYLSEGVQLYEAGDLSSARNAFLKVLTLSESDATARNYLNQIDAALAIPGAGAPAPVSSSAAGLDEPYLRDELEAPVRPSFAEGLPSLEEHARSGSSLEEMPLEGGRVQAEAPGRRGKVDVRLLLGVGALVLVGVAAVAFFLFKPKSTGPSPEAAAPPAAGAPAQDPLQKAKALFQQGKVDEALEILTAIPSGDPRHEQAYVLIEQFKSSAEPQPSASPAASEALVDEARLAGLASLSSGRYIDAVKSLDLVVKARPDDGEAAQALSRARDAVAALGSAIRSYNEQDYESAQRLLWEIRKADPKNQDVEEYLFKSYFNDGILSLQSGSTKKAADAFKEAAALRPQDVETQRHLKFARRYASGTDDLLARIYVKHVSPRP